MHNVSSLYPQYKTEIPTIQKLIELTGVFARDNGATSRRLGSSDKLYKQASASINPVCYNDNDTFCTLSSLFKLLFLRYFRFLHDTFCISPRVTMYKLQREATFIFDFCFYFCFSFAFILFSFRFILLGYTLVLFTRYDSGSLAFFSAF